MCALHPGRNGRSHDAGKPGLEPVLWTDVRIIRGAKYRGEPCPSFLLRGGSGPGKSTLAKALSEEYGSEFHRIVATKQTDAVALGLEARKWGACDFVLTDEPHVLDPATQELLYSILDESMAPAVEERDDGRRPRLAGRVEVPPITLVLATDQAGLLCRALKTRMELDFTLDPYGVREMILIARQRASQLNMLISPQAARLLAETSHGVPRLLGHRVENMVHYYAKDWPMSFSDALGQVGLEELRRLIEKKLAEMPAVTDEDEWSEERFARFRAQTLLKETLGSLGDVDIWVCKEQGRLDLEAGEIAEKLLAAGRARDALDFLEQNATDRTREDSGGLPGLRSKILLKLGRRKEAIQALWRGFTKTLSEDDLTQALTLASETRRKKLEDEALEVAEEFHDAVAGLWFLTSRAALDRAAALVDRRLSEISGYWYDGIRECAKRLAEEHPRQAWLLLRILLLDILKRARSKAYRHGVRYLNDMAGLAKRGKFDDEHEEFATQLRKDHGRKWSFWKKADGPA